MNYDLALKLKNAGFPQGEIGSWICCVEGLHVGRESEDDIYVPTLSELIEACGDSFYSLHIVSTTKGNWEARATSDEIGTGFTPEEAVANLWLALQDNK